ncbi:MAG: hypothetical protein AB7E60_04400 [Sphingobium sp.]
MDRPAERQTLLAGLLDAAAREAEEILARPGNDVQLRVICDDGFSQIERLHLSPFVEDQLMAVALRLAHERGSTRVAALADHFRIPALSIAIEAQRRAVWADGNGGALPMERAARALAVLEGRLQGVEDVPTTLRGYAELYADFWCDPRIGATCSARRIMLALVTALHARAEGLEETMPGRRRSGVRRRA